MWLLFDTLLIKSKFTYWWMAIFFVVEASSLSAQIAEFEGVSGIQLNNDIHKVETDSQSAAENQLTRNFATQIRQNHRFGLSAIQNKFSLLLGAIGNNSQYYDAQAGLRWYREKVRYEYDLALNLKQQLMKQYFNQLSLEEQVAARRFGNPAADQLLRHDSLKTESFDFRYGDTYHLGSTEKFSSKYVGEITNITRDAYHAKENALYHNIEFQYDYPLWPRIVVSPSLFYSEMNTNKSASSDESGPSVKTHSDDVERKAKVTFSHTVSPRLNQKIALNAFSNSYIERSSYHGLGVEYGVLFLLTPRDKIEATALLQREQSSAKATQNAYAQLEYNHLITSITSLDLSYAKREISLKTSYDISTKEYLDTVSQAHHMNEVSGRLERKSSYFTAEIYGSRSEFFGDDGSSVMSKDLLKESLSAQINIVMALILSHGTYHTEEITNIYRAISNGESSSISVRLAQSPREMTKMRGSALLSYTNESTRETTIRRKDTRDLYTANISFNY